VGSCPLFVFQGRFTAQTERLERVRAVASRVAGSNGLEIFDVQLRREPIGMVLRVVIDKPDPGRVETAEESVGIADCQRVSQDLSALLDVEDEFGQDDLGETYTLEVSSPGLDRPLREPADFGRFAGRRAKLVMREKVDGQGYFKGTLGGMEDGPVKVVLIEGEDKRTHRVPLDVITRANLEVDF